MEVYSHGTQHNPEDSMKTSFFTTFLTAGLLALGVAACDSASGLDTASNSEALQALASELGMSAADMAEISASFSSVDPETGEIRDPGELWRLAAQLHSTMSDEQIERLMQRAAEMRMQRPGMRPGRPGMRPGQQGQWPDLNLTDEQEAAIQAIHEAARAEVQALRAQDLDRDALREAIQAIREATHAEVEAVLTDEQRQVLADHRADAEARRAEAQARRADHRAEAEAVRNEVLGLTAEQIAGLEELESARDAFRESQQAARDAGASPEELRAAAEAFHTGQKEALQALLTETQFEITAVHRFLSQRAGQGRPGGQGGPGGPGGHGPNGRPGQNG
jgi:Spy/CpxP family protein refolding chaperone